MPNSTFVEPNAEELARLKRWRLSTFWVMLVGYIGYYLVRGNLSVALPLLSQAYGYTNVELGAILSISEVSYAIGKFTTGPLADRIGGKKVFMLGFVGAILFNFIFPLYASVMYFTVIWCFVRYFLSMGWGGIIKIIGAWYEPEKHGTAMGLISINFQFGGAFTAMFSSFLITLALGWQSLFYIPAAVCTVIAIISYFASKESPQDVVPNVRFGKNAGLRKAAADFSAQNGQRRSTKEIVVGLLKVPLFRQVLVFSFFTHILRSFFMFWIPKFMVDLGMANVAAGMTSAVFPLVGCLGTVGLGWYTDKYAADGDRSSAIWKMLVGLVVTLTIIAFLVPYNLEYQTGIIVMLGLSGFFLYGPYSMSAGCLTLDIAGSEGAGTCTGFIDGIGYIGGALAAWGAGLIADAFGWQEVFFTLAGTAVCTTVWSYYMSSYAKAKKRAAI